MQEVTLVTKLHVQPVDLNVVSKILIEDLTVPPFVP